MMRSSEDLNPTAIAINTRPRPKLDKGPAIAVRNSTFGVEVDCDISDTPPKMKSVICRTSTPNRRATTQWLSS
jgi:hypothetical protein